MCEAAAAAAATAAYMPKSFGYCTRASRILEGQRDACWWYSHVLGEDNVGGESGMMDRDLRDGCCDGKYLLFDYCW